MRRVFIIFSVAIVIPLSLMSRAAGVNDQAQQESPPGVGLNPATVDFGDQVVKRVSKPRRVTVTNTGGKPLYINSAALTGDHQDDFTFVSDTCTGATIAPNKSCVLDVIFAPRATRKRAATVVLTDNAIDSPQQIPLTGNGINSVRARPDGLR